MHLFPSSADPNHCIFVRNLSFHCTNQSLRALFKSFSVQSVNVMRGERDQSMYYGTVVLRRQSDVDRAIRYHSNRLFQGRYLMVEKFSAESVHASQQQRPEMRCQLQISFKQKHRARSAPRLVITEEMIRDKLAQIGNVLDVLIKKHYIDSHQMLGGYAFVQYEQIESVYRSINELNDEVVDGVHWHLRISNKFQAQLPQLLVPQEMAYAEEDYVDEKEGSFEEGFSSQVATQMIPMSAYPHFGQPHSPYNAGFALSVPRFGMLPPSPAGLYPFQGFYFNQHPQPPPMMQYSPLLQRVADGAVPLPAMPIPMSHARHFYPQQQMMNQASDQNGYNYYLSNDTGDGSIVGFAPDAGYYETQSQERR